MPFRRFIAPRFTLIALAVAPGCFAFAPGASGAGGLGDIRVDPAKVVEVRGEKMRLRHIPSHLFRGAVLKMTRSGEDHTGNPVRYSLDPDSVVVRHGERVLEAGKDYLLQPEWAALVLAPESSITPEDFVSVDYRCSMMRIDSLVRTADGREEVRKGEDRVSEPQPPALGPGETRVANFFVHRFNDGREPIVLPVPASPVDAPTATLAGRIPRTMEKIRSGKPVRIVCWGDSVTHGAEASDREKTSYVAVFDALLRERFPDADITVDRVAVGGMTSSPWLYPERYAEKKKRDDRSGKRLRECRWELIAEPPPDLVTIEFINDSRAIRTKEQFDEIYHDIHTRLTALGAEIVYITPNYSMFHWPETLRSPDPRPYTGWLRDFARERGAGLADTAARWENLWREGLPWLTHLRSINHPNDGGHRLYAEELIKCFGE